ncbi:GH16809 [Drosophila grimshawi]|uniref:GH16809 n=1 Tax=Drosophila grimshawi TaxID=7222 RepID=B4IWU3_DROGR|nr:GH16809 [Drosophila grimshawi]
MHVLIGGKGKRWRVGGKVATCPVAHLTWLDIKASDDSDDDYGDDGDDGDDDDDCVDDDRPEQCRGKLLKRGRTKMNGSRQAQCAT